MLWDYLNINLDCFEKMQPFCRRSNSSLSEKSVLNAQLDTIQASPLPYFSQLIEEFLSTSSSTIDLFMYRYLEYLSESNGSCYNCYFTSEQSKAFKYICFFWFILIFLFVIKKERKNKVNYNIIFFYYFLLIKFCLNKREKT